MHSTRGLSERDGIGRTTLRRILVNAGLSSPTKLADATPGVIP